MFGLTIIEKLCAFMHECVCVILLWLFMPEVLDYVHTKLTNSGRKTKNLISRLIVPSQPYLTLGSL